LECRSIALLCHDIKATELAVKVGKTKNRSDLDANFQEPSNGKSRDTRPQLSSLVFGIGREEYAIDILSVQELCNYTRVTEIANVPKHYKGVVNLRGSIVPLIDLRIYFGFSEPSYDNSTVVIMVTMAGRTTGIVVDSVADVVTLDAKQIMPAPETGQSNANYILAMANIDDLMVIILDIDSLLQDIYSSQAKLLAA